MEIHNKCENCGVISVCESYNGICSWTTRVYGHLPEAPRITGWSQWDYEKCPSCSVWSAYYFFDELGERIKVWVGETLPFNPVEGYPELTPLVDYINRVYNPPPPSEIKIKHMNLILKSMQESK